MKKLTLTTFFLLAMALNAYPMDTAGYLFFGRYCSSVNNYVDVSQTRLAQYRAGVFTEVDLWREHFFIYNKITALMDKQNDNNSFHPAGIKFRIGLKTTYGRHEIRLEHECWHPVDTGGDVGEYNLIEYRLNY